MNLLCWVEPEIVHCVFMFQAYKTEQKKERERAYQRIENWKKLDQLARANPDMEKITSMMRTCNFDVVMTNPDDDSDGGGAAISGKGTKNSHF